MKTDIFSKSEPVVSFFDLLFHGGPVEVKKPEILKPRFYRDFGNGFYTTNIKDQAIRWVHTKSKQGYISEYKCKTLSDLNVKMFTDLSEEWLDHITTCRLGGSHDFDIVEGPMADDKIYNFVNDYIDGVLSKDRFFELCKFSHPTHQRAFCTEKALSHLVYVRSEKVESWS